MQLTPETYEIAARDAWVALKANDPLKPIETIMKDEWIWPIHVNLVTALLKEGCDPSRGFMHATKGKQTLEAQFESTKKWVPALANFLRNWAADRGY
jgi:hypothetical protein